MKILLLEDNVQLAESLGDFLCHKGDIVDFAYNAASCLTLVEQNSYDVLVLDISMPGMSGLEACRLIRSKLMVATPIIFLTARDTLDDKVRGYQSGCDDYLIKPFAPEELHCRLQALTLRGPRRDVGTFQVGELIFDNSNNTVMRLGKKIKLHQTQYQLLVVLAQSYPNPVTKDALERAIWKDDLPESDALRTHLYRLRNNIDKPFNRPCITTVHNKGYKLEFS